MRSQWMVGDCIGREDRPGHGVGIMLVLVDDDDDDEDDEDGASCFCRFFGGRHISFKVVVVVVDASGTCLRFPARAKVLKVP